MAILHFILYFHFPLIQNACVHYSLSLPPLVFISPSLPHPFLNSCMRKQGAALELPQGRRDSHREFKYSNSNSTCAATKRATTTNPAASAKAQTAPQPTSSRATPIGRRSKQDKSSSSSRRSSRRKNNGTVSGGSTYGTRRSTNDITNTSSGSGNRRAPNARRASAGDRVDFAEVSLPPIGRNPLQSSRALATVDRSPVRRSPLRCYGADKGEEEYDDDDGDDDDEIEPPRFRALQVL